MSCKITANHTLLHYFLDMTRAKQLDQIFKIISVTVDGKVYKKLNDIIHSLYGTFWFEKLLFWVLVEGRLGIVCVFNDVWDHGEKEQLLSNHRHFCNGLETL